MTTGWHDLVERLAGARRDPSVVVVEGAHAIKHALRFGATLDQVVVREGTPPDQLPLELVEQAVPLTAVPAEVFARIVDPVPPVPVVAVAQRPSLDVSALLAGDHATPLVVLERPTHPGNLGAVVRVAAAAGVAGVLAIGGGDPWHPRAVRGAAGLQFALPVARLDQLPDGDRPIVGFDPAGLLLGSMAPPPRALLTFGSERAGLSAAMRARADVLVRIPMRRGVSSLNLATAVAIAVYAWPTEPA